MADPARSGLMSVKADLVRKHLVGGILGAVEARGAFDPPDEVASILRGATALVQSDVADGASDATRASDLARHGYLSRLVESEMFEPARDPMPWLADALDRQLEDGSRSWPDAVAEVAQEFAAAERDARPDPEQTTVTWKVPGPGGHVRHYVASAAIGGAGTRGPAALKRAWVFGFVVRCCEETRDSVRASRE
jgi:hypothetical protein